MIKRETRLIYLTGTHSWLFTLGVNGLSLIGYDECNAGHIPNFLDQLAATPQVPTAVLIDVIDEQYNIGEVPHARGADRRAVLRRHAERVFRNSPYRYTEVHGRTTQGRKDDIVLTTCLVNPDQFVPLLVKLREAAVSVSGVYSLPIAAAEMLRDLPKGSGQRLLVTHHSSGIRLSFYLDRKLKMSRLTPVRDSEPDALARQIRDEVDKTQKYLGRLRLLAHTVDLTVHLLVDDGMMGPLLVECVDGGSIRYTINPISQWLQPVNLDNDWPVTSADCLMAQVAMVRKLVDHYGTKEDRRYSRLYRSVTQMRQAGAAAVVFSFAAAGIYVWDAKQLDYERDQAALDDQRYTREYMAIESRLPEIPLPAKELKAAVRAAEKLVAMQQLPTEVFGRLSQSLEEFPDFKLTQLHWRTVTPDDLILEEVVPTDGDAPVEQEIYDDNGNFIMRYVTTLTAEISNFDGNYVNANTKVGHLIDSILAGGFFKSARILRATVSDGAKSSLQGSYDRRMDSDAQSPEVVVEVVLEKKYEP